MNTNNQLLCAWTGLVCAILFYVALWPLAHFIPPYSPLASATEVVAKYEGNRTGIRLGMIVLQIAGALFVPFAAVISSQMKRIEGQFSALSSTQLASAVGLAIFLQLPAMTFTVTAFRPERSPELILLLNDLAWIYLMMAIAAASVQNFAIGFTILSDKNPNPVFPRWVAYANFWVGIGYLPGNLLTFFKVGPFAWDGLFSFYFVALIFAIWFCVMIPAVFKAIRQQAETR